MLFLRERLRPCVVPEAASNGSSVLLEIYQNNWGPRKTVVDLFQNNGFHNMGQMNSHTWMLSWLHLHC